MSRGAAPRPGSGGRRPEGNATRAPRGPHGVGALEGAAGVRLRTLSWHAESPKARVVLVHGLGEHAGRYAPLAEALARRGYSVLAYDQRGHGRSQGRRGYVPGFDLFVEDLGRVVSEAEESLAGSGRPFLYGHSMGALVLLRFLQGVGPDAPGAILSAPWLGTAAAIPRWKLLAAAVLRRTAPWFVLPTSVDPADLTSDEALQRAYLTDPLVTHGISVALYDAVLDAQGRALRGGAPAGPALVLLPLLDPLTDLAKAAEWAEAAGPVVEVIRLPGMRHEPQNERGREEVFHLVADWMDARTPGGPGG